MTYAFSFDASACSGCKACQVACKDKNNLSVGVLWRRVIEVTGGGWIKDGAAWRSSVFSYNLSLACNHCVHPKCAGVCPTNAYKVRDDGIVILDSSKCVGCGYCNWACPYAVPQYDQAAGLMSKCNFCFDAIDAGDPPACVAACPMRVLDFIKVDDKKIEKPGFSLWEAPGSEHPFPLPVYSRTQPHIRINPHPAMLNSLAKEVANQNEIKPKDSKNEFPLIVFSLFVQMAVGAYWAMQWMFKPLIDPGSHFIGLLPGLLVGLSLSIGMLVSFNHLGVKRNAWRMLANLHKSWLSREILFLGLFGAGWLSTILFPFKPLVLLTSFLGFGLIYSMANVYRLRSMAAWNSWRTLTGFLLTSLLLGQFLLLPVLTNTGQATGISQPVNISLLNLFPLVLMVGELALAAKWKMSKFTVTLRVILIVVIISGLVLVLSAPQFGGLNAYIILFALLIIEESLGRFLFYAELKERLL